MKIKDLLILGILVLIPVAAFYYSSQERAQQRRSWEETCYLHGERFYELPTGLAGFTPTCVTENGEVRHRFGD